MQFPIIMHLWFSFSEPKAQRTPVIAKMTLLYMMIIMTSVVSISTGLIDTGNNYVFSWYKQSANHFYQNTVFDAWCHYKCNERLNQWLEFPSALCKVHDSNYPSSLILVGEVGERSWGLKQNPQQRKKEKGLGREGDKMKFVDVRVEKRQIIGTREGKGR